MKIPKNVIKIKGKGCGGCYFKSISRCTYPKCPYKIYVIDFSVLKKL